MRDPGSTWAPLPEAGAPDGYRKTQLIFHSTGTLASAAANRRYFEQMKVAVESTFIVGLTADDPTLQVMDSTDKADANGASNRRAISVEVVGTGDMPFTEWQVSELVRIGRWAVENHPIPRVRIPDPVEGGTGWHVMFGAPSAWTTVRGKVCPGSRRITQLREVVFPAIFRTETTPAPEDDDMTEDDRKIRNAQHDQLLQHLSADRRTAIDTQAKVNDLYKVLVEIRDLLKPKDV